MAKGITITIPPTLLKKLLPWIAAILLGGGGSTIYTRDTNDQTARLERLERMQEEILSVLMKPQMSEEPAGPAEGGQ